MRRFFWENFPYGEIHKLIVAINSNLPQIPMVILDKNKYK